MMVEEQSTYLLWRLELCTFPVEAYKHHWLHIMSSSCSSESNRWIIIQSYKCHLLISYCNICSIVSIIDSFDLLVCMCFDCISSICLIKIHLPLFAYMCSGTICDRHHSIPFLDQPVHMASGKCSGYWLLYSFWIYSVQVSYVPYPMGSRSFALSPVD